MNVCEDFSGRQYEEISSFHNAEFNLGSFTRFVTSLSLLLIYIRNKRHAASSQGMYSSRALILPSYFQFVFTLMISYAIFVSET